jgi:hypothetical protein
MKKIFALVTALVMAVCALTVVSFTYDVTPDVVVSGGETANAISTSSADSYTADRQDYPVGLNEENQYDILADNELYGHVDYGDYVPAEVRYVNGFPYIDGDMKNSQYYEDKPYIPTEEDKPWEEWNLHDFHKNGEYFETIGNGTMNFYTVEDMEAYVDSLKEEYGAENIHETWYDANGNPTDSPFSGVQDTVDEVNEQQEDMLDMLDSLG